MRDDTPPSAPRVRLFGEVDVEGENIDATVRLRPLSRALLAYLALAPAGERMDTDQLAKRLVMKVDPSVPVAPDKLSSARQQLRNAQWELRKRLGDRDAGARLQGAGRRWVALEGAETDHRDFLRAVDAGDTELALAIAGRGPFLDGIDDAWTAPHRDEVHAKLRALEHRPRGRAVTAPARARDPTAARRSRTLPLIAVAVVAAVAVAVGVALLGDPDPPRPSPPDAARAPADIRPDGKPVTLEERPSGRCQNLVPGARSAQIATITTGGQAIAEVRTYHAAAEGRVCAKLVKVDPQLQGRLSHLAFTLCGDGRACERDWHAYRVDAGPLIVLARDGCVSWRASIADPTGRWLVRDRVGQAGCS